MPGQYLLAGEAEKTVPFAVGGQKIDWAQLGSGVKRMKMSRTRALVLGV